MIGGDQPSSDLQMEVLYEPGEQKWTAAGGPVCCNGAPPHVRSSRTMVHSRPVIVFPFARTGKAALADAHDAKTP